MYRELIDFETQDVSLKMVLRVEGGLTIPFVRANIDYQEYVQWLEEGNTPLPPQ